MAFATDTLARAAFKKLQGLAHTAGTKDLANESESSGIQVAANEVYADGIASSPVQAVSDGVAAFVSLDLSLDPSSNGKAYTATIATVTGTGLEGKTNPKTGAIFQNGDRVGDIIPPKYGDSYRAILYSSSVEVPPLSSEDWFIDYKSGIITSEDNLALSGGTLDGYVYVGKYLSDVSLPRAPIYPFTSGDFDAWATIYVTVGGSDATGDGSIGNPYRQPQRALEDIILPGGGGAYVIQCGPGDFEAPYFEAYNAPSAPDSFYINIVGDRSAPVYNVTANVYSADSGKYASYTTPRVGFSSADPYQYWIGGEFSYLPGWVYATPVLQSSDGYLKVPIDLTGYYDEDAAIYPFSTTFSFAPTIWGVITGNKTPTAINAYRIYYTGIKFTPTGTCTFTNIGLAGCSIVCDISHSIFFQNVDADFTGTAGSLRLSGFGNNSLGGYFSGGITTQGYNIYSLTHNVASGQHLNLFNQFAYIGNVDFIGTTTKIKLFNGSITQAGPISVAGTTNLMTLSQNSVFTCSGTGTITGSCNAVPIIVASGSQILGIKAAANGTLTNSAVPGNEITVGSNPTVSFSALPKTDYGLGDLSQGCRAT